MDAGAARVEVDGNGVSESNRSQGREPEMDARCIAPLPSVPMAAPASVLVTGATGFVGGALARHLAAEGRRVVGMGRRVDAGAALERDGVAFVRDDGADTVRRAVEGVEAVVHCAALAAPWGRAADFMAANVEATRVVAEACADAGRRLVHLSTPSVYFHLDDRLGVHEDDPLPATPANLYAATKLVADRVIEAHVAVRRLDALVLRPRAIYGEGDRTVFPRLIRALAARKLPIVGDGQNVASVTYIGTVVNVLVAGLDADARWDGLVVNVADREPVRIWDVIGRLCDRLALPRPTRRVPVDRLLALAGAVEAFHRRFRPTVEPTLTRYGVAVVGRSQTLSTARMEARIGAGVWQVGPDEGMERFARWWEAGGSAAA